MQEALVGRGGDVSNGERGRHDGLAWLCAAELTGKPLRARTLNRFFWIVGFEMNVARSTLKTQRQFLDIDKDNPSSTSDSI